MSPVLLSTAAKLRVVAARDAILQEIASAVAQPDFCRCEVAAARLYRAMFARESFHQRPIFSLLVVGAKNAL